MAAATLPGRAGQRRADRRDQPVVGISGDQLHPGQPAGDPGRAKRPGSGAVFGRGDLETADLTVPVGVDSGGDQRVHAHHPGVFADLDRAGQPGRTSSRSPTTRPSPRADPVTPTPDAFPATHRVHIVRSGLSNSSRRR